MDFQFRTRENASPHGKPSVYFTAHPADAAAYLEDIQREILYLQDCVIWYDPKTDRQADETFLSELSFMKMQLMVIPVTEKLLTEPNRVVQSELPYAQENHIPVLPIVMEPGLESLYEAVFGDLQFLDKFSRDTTAISYEKKLGKHLESVLVSDENIKKIRESFDARIFLSYRKKDRALAQKLMHLIHEVPQLQSVGIWYDEFLVPGEGFNGGIRDAIHASDLFVLAVTPNLVNEDNFIRENEYKWAKEEYKEAHKQVIIPAQMEKTDQSEMYACFADIRDNVDAYRNDELHPALLEPLSGKHLGENRDPQHKYLMGLAYLHGIDMETDQTTGARLIREAAEADHLEAKKKLVQMYFRGHGVSRDPDESVRWQYRVVEQYKARYEQDGSEENWLPYAKEQVYLGDDLVQMRKWEEAAGAFKAARELFENRLQQREDTYCRERLLYICNELGNAYVRLDNKDAAIAVYKKTIETAQPMIEDGATLIMRQQYAQIQSNLGSIYQELGHSDDALRCCLASMKLAEQLSEEDGSDHTVHLKAMIAYHLGGIYADRGIWRDAEQYYSMAMRLMGQIIKRFPTAADILFEAECICGAGQCLEMQEDFDGAQTAYQKSVDLIEGVRKLYQTEQVQEAWERSQMHLECLQIGRNGKMGDLRPRFVKAADDRAADPNLQNLRAQAWAHQKWAKACSAGGNFPKAEKCFQKVIRLLTDVAQQTQLPEDDLALATANMDLAEVLRRANGWDRMLKPIHEAQNIAEAALEKKDLLELRKELARSHLYRGRFYQNLGSNYAEAALECYQAALPLFAQLTQETNHLHMRLFFAECKADIAWRYLEMDAQKHSQLANDYSRQAMEEMECLYQLDKALETVKLMEKCCQVRGLSLLFDGHKKEALTYFTRAYELNDRLLNKTGDPHYRDQCAMMCYFMAESVDGKKKREHLRRACAIAEKLCKEHPFDARYKKTLDLILATMKRT